MCTVVLAVNLGACVRGYAFDLLDTGQIRTISYNALLRKCTRQSLCSAHGYGKFVPLSFCPSACLSVCLSVGNITKP
jgi:hypothetical protein